MVYNGLVGNWPRDEAISQTDQLHGLIIISSPLSSLASPASVDLKFTLASIFFSLSCSPLFTVLGFGTSGGGWRGGDGGWRWVGGGCTCFRSAVLTENCFLTPNEECLLPAVPKRELNYRKNALLCPKTFTHANVSSRNLLYGAVGLCTVLFKSHNDETHRHRKKTKRPCSLMVRNRRTGRGETNGWKQTEINRRNKG